MDIGKQILEAAKKIKGKVIFPESFDIRILKAASMLTKNAIASVVLPTNNLEDIKNIAKNANIDLTGIEIISMDRSLLNGTKIKFFVEARMKKGMSEQDSIDLLKNPLYFSMMYLKSGECDACVGGAVYDSADVLRAAIYVIGTQEGIKMISSYFLMIPPENHPIAKEPLMFADCAVNPEPQALGLHNIAVSTVDSYKKIFPGKIANVAMLSFSTKGSATNKMLSKIIEATQLTKEYYKEDSSVNVDGELQFDASIVPSVGKRKAPNSLVAGNANILIFPDLNTGNISYKIAERFGGFQALGPILQGLSLPVSDLSRGSSAEDIYLISAIMLLNKR
ncbi:MAG: phosphate acetyltransferase [Endomicrobium sp.]|jgi:phosphate acetyltransferase|uniref:phosphate acetyltransferase n=1 Tax=Candidatus Endomicrobiellum cubanum TaxID=3242325 RepID=UPI00282E96BC|nr:phosphate acetyltransferase [Endomicrobium sp.]